MKIKVERSKNLPVLDKPEFRKCKITDIDKELSQSEFGYMFNVTVEVDGINFPITKTIFINKDLTDVWKIKKFAEAIGLEPIAVLESEDGLDEYSYNFEDAVNKESVALVYQDDFVNIWDFVSNTTTDSIKAGVMSRLMKYLSRKARKGVESSSPGLPPGNPTESADVPF